MGVLRSNLGNVEVRLSRDEKYLASGVSQLYVTMHVCSLSQCTRPITVAKAIFPIGSIFFGTPQDR